MFVDDAEKVIERIFTQIFRQIFVGFQMSKIIFFRPFFNLRVSGNNDAYFTLVIQ